MHQVLHDGSVWLWCEECESDCAAETVREDFKSSHLHPFLSADAHSDMCRLNHGHIICSIPYRELDHKYDVKHETSLTEDNIMEVHSI